ncbi:MAG: glycosyltransferase family A protein [Ilumatobacteraceae bacterium]
MSGLTRLSAIIPCFNGGAWIGQCLAHLTSAADRAALDAFEVVVVDDGSTDDTASAVLAWAAEASHDVRLVTQPNQGRFRARRAGLDAAKYEVALFIDTRVFMDEESIANVATLYSEPDHQVWTAHVTANTELSPIAGFWQAIEHVAWRRYFRRPRTMSYGLDEFDYFPKGTTALIGPKQLFVDAFDAFVPTVSDWSKVNDDTAVLRWVAARTPINISPLYSCVYNSRTDVAAFVKHANHRGTVLIDGYLRRGARFARPIAAVLAVSPVALWFTVRHPLRAAALGVVGSVGAGTAARAAGARAEDARVLGVLAVPFGVSYLAGMWRGLVIRLRMLWQRQVDS